VLSRGNGDRHRHRRARQKASRDPAGQAQPPDRKLSHDIPAEIDPGERPDRGVPGELRHKARVEGEVTPVRSKERPKTELVLLQEEDRAVLRPELGGGRRERIPGKARYDLEGKHREDEPDWRTGSLGFARRPREAVKPPSRTHESAGPRLV